VVENVHALDHRTPSQAAAANVLGIGPPKASASERIVYRASGQSIGRTRHR
jgi:hypothetical protein